MTKKNEDAPVAPAPSSASSDAPERLTPAEWAARKGLIGKPDPVRPWEPPPKAPSYAAADALHGWSQDAHDYQAEADLLRLLEDDFNKALDAAGKYPAVPAHEPACGRSPGFKDRAKPVKDPHTGATLAEGKTVHAPKPPKAVKTDG